jgi:tetratricopeptide (TPR) repeat protein
MIALLFALSLAAPEPGQQHTMPAEQTPATLVGGLGTLHHPIATKSEEAQRFFDQGLTFVYAFNHDEAIRSFRRAAELDPASPMPHWGIAFALGPNINLPVDPERELAAHEAAQRARALAAGAPPIERAYVDAIVKRYSNDPKADLQALAVQYKDAMRALTRAYPDDLDARTLYADSLMNLHPWQLWAKDGTPTEGTEEIVAVLESVLKRDAMHVGANHLYIHTVEASTSPDRALPSARRLETLVPAAGHLVHMPAHIYMRTGDYRAAVTSNERGAQADRAYIAASGAGGVYPLMYFNHNLDFLASAAMMSGQFADAVKAADELVPNVMPVIADMPMAEPFAAKKLFVLLRFSRWSDVLAFPPPDARHSVLTATHHFGRGVAYAAMGRHAEAAAARTAYTAAKRAVAADAPWGNNEAPAVLAVMSAVLDARIARAQGDAKAAIAAWRQAVAAEDALDYNEPSDWFYPARESLGAELLRAGELAEAERVFQEDLGKNPRNPRSLFGRWQTLLKGGKKAEAAAAESAFREAWRFADVTLRLDDY